MRLILKVRGLKKMESAKITRSDRILRVSWKDEHTSNVYIFVFKKPLMAKKLKKYLKENIKDIDNSPQFEEHISDLEHEALLNRKDISVMAEANDNLPKFYEEAWKQGVDRIYLGVNF